MVKNKAKALELLKQKSNGEIEITYNEIAGCTGYSRMQLNRFTELIEKKDIDSMFVHGLSNKPSNNSTPSKEIEYIKNFKKQYPVISISQFMDFYHECVIWNKDKNDDVVKFNLKLRSYSFFESIYHQYDWIIPRPHKSFYKNKDIHALRNPSPRRGILIIIDGTPHDWFQNGKVQSLHLAIDDATGEYLAGWFMATECLEGYCHLLKLIITKFGIPLHFYSDNHTIFKSPKDGNLTTFGRICDELGIEMIFAGSPEAKGKVEKANDTIQQRLLNDIKRHNIISVDQLNIWFNKSYVKYLNKKFAYPPKEVESEFVALGEEFNKSKLNDIFCIKDTRTILDGNCISYNNNYYVPLDKDNKVAPIYKGSTVEIWENIFDHSIKISTKNNTLYKTKQIQGHRQDPEKAVQLKVQNQKELEAALRLRDERKKARANLPD